MALFGSSNNREEYCRTEPGYDRTGYSDHVHHPVILDSNGMKHSIVGYTATHNSQRYEAKTEQVVKYGNAPGFPAMTDRKYSNPRKDGYKDHGVGDKPHTVPRISARDGPEKNSEFFPKARDHEVVNRQSKNTPWNNAYRDNSPPSKDQYRTGSHHDYGKHNNALNPKTSNKYHDDDDDDDEDDVICNDGVCFKNPREGYSKPNYFEDENYNENEKRRGNGYNPPTYTVPISTQPKRDTYYKTPHISTTINTNNNDQKEKGNSYDPRNFPSITTQPRSKDHTNNYYEANINKPTATNPPQFNAAPKRDQETIDSTEARLRYGTGRPGAGTGSGYDEGQNGRAIDSKEAARLYGGVFLPN